MKLIFNNFFYDQDLSPFLYLFKLVFNEPIEIGQLEDSDILIESIFGNNTFLYKKKWKYSFCFIGESDRRIPIFTQNLILKDYSCVLKGEINNKNIVNFPLFVFYNYCYKFVYEYKNKPRIVTIPTKEVCVLISNNDSEGRNVFLSHLEQRVKIDYAGSYKNNVKKLEAPHCSKEFIQFVSQYKIIISMENSKNKDYITEKILHGFSANTIPVYWGSDNISTYFNEERFVNVKSFNIKDMVEAIEKIVALINNPVLYLETVNKPIYKDEHVPLTLTHISHHIQNLLQIKSTQHKRFITFGNELYYNSVRRICKEAQNLKFFNEIYGYSDKYLKKEEDFWLKHGHFLESNKRGYGYWLWKPYLIKTELDKMNENDILVYCDSGCQVNEQGKRRLHEYIDMLNTSEHGILSFQLEFLEPLYTKNQVFETLEFKKNVLQCMATVIILKKNANSSSIINEWYEHCENYDLINDDNGKEDPRFIDHRHDQSILSVLVNKRGSLKITDETYFSNWNDGTNYPFLAKRLR
jgi:hypothetical protein